MTIFSMLEHSLTVVLKFDSINGIFLQNPIAMHILIAFAQRVALLLLKKTRGRCICAKRALGERLKQFR
jgi:hypothetical protein